MLLWTLTAALTLGTLTACGNSALTDAPFTSSASVTTVQESAPAPSLGADEYRATVTDTVGGREFSAMPAKDGYCFYLPGVNDLSALTFNCWLGEEVSATVHGQTFPESVRFALDASATQLLKITYTQADGSFVTERYTFCASSAGILSLSVDESLGTVDAMNRDPDHETYCYGSLTYLAEDEGYDFSSYFSLKGRGNATWDDEKKGYALKLYESDSYTDKNKLSISGMGRSANWALVANHRDRTLIRNALAQTLAAKLGMENAVRFVFVDLYINGEYRGLYNLMQKVESGAEQVNITEAKSDSLDGGYLLEFDNYSDTPQIKLQQSGMRVTVNSPADLESYTAIERLLNEAEAAIFDPYGYNWETGLYWDHYIDAKSFAILWMVREYTMDNDATVNFRFYYDPADGKFHGGPVWDFDNSMARNTGIFAEPETALIENGYRNANCWLRKLMEFDAFREEIVRLYDEHSELFDSSAPDSVYALAYRYADGLSYSIGKNFTVWEKQLANKSWNTPDELTYEGHFAILTDFLYRRNAFWESYIPALTDR
ncbi:MAG: CotH kinase family protein [Clostridia bacterium]|nr:CotH kinase family protein [Clostridia bacterium]